MARSSSKSSSRSTNRSASKAVNRGNRRSNPMTPKAGFTIHRSRYGTGGKV